MNIGLSALYSNVPSIVFSSSSSRNFSGFMAVVIYNVRVFLMFNLKIFSLIINMSSVQKSYNIVLTLLTTLAVFFRLLIPAIDVHEVALEGRL